MSLSGSGVVCRQMFESFAQCDAFQEGVFLPEPIEYCNEETTANIVFERPRLQMDSGLTER